MNVIRVTLLVYFGSLCFSLSQVVPSESLVNWTLGTTVGVQGGIPDRQTIYTTLAAGSTAAQINTAIANCPSNQVVKLGAGTFNLSAPLTIYNNGVTVRGSGSGAGGTLLKPSGNAFTIGAISYPDGGTISITSGYAKGATNLTLTSAATVSVGEVVKIDQVMDTSFMWSSDGTGVRTVTQHAIITAKNSNVITIWPPLFYGLTPANTPQVHKFTGDFTRMSGIEDLKIDLSGGADYFVMMFNDINCWMKNVQETNGNGYYNYWDYTLFCEFVKNNLNGPTSFGPNHGGLLLGQVGIYNNAALGCTAAAVYDNIFIKVGPGIEVNTGSAGCIISYNFCYDGDYGTMQLPGIDLNHSAENMFNLYEGNLVNMFSSDGYFGGECYDTVFRNWSTGWTPTHPTDQSIGIALLERSMYDNVVGNVFGITNNATPVRFAPDNDFDLATPYIYILGVNKSVSDSYNGGAFDAGVSNTMTFHSNWDSNQKAIDWGTNSSHTLPNSLYLAGKPTWFYSLSWPPFNPTTGYTNEYWNSIPAGYRYLNSGNDPPPDTSTPVSSASIGTGTVRVSNGKVILSQ